MEHFWPITTKVDWLFYDEVLFTRGKKNALVRVEHRIALIDFENGGYIESQLLQPITCMDITNDGTFFVYCDRETLHGISCTLSGAHTVKKGIQLQSWHQKLSTVPQNVYIVKGTIYVRSKADCIFESNFKGEKTKKDVAHTRVL